MSEAQVQKLANELWGSAPEYRWWLVALAEARRRIKSQTKK